MGCLGRGKVVVAPTCDREFADAMALLSLMVDFFAARRPSANLTINFFSQSSLRQSTHMSEDSGETTSATERVRFMTQNLASISQRLRQMRSTADISSTKAKSLAAPAQLSEEESTSQVAGGYLFTRHPGVKATRHTATRTRRRRRRQRNGPPHEYTARRTKNRRRRRRVHSKRTDLCDRDHARKG